MPTSPAQLVQQILFGLNGLSERNGHHQFEDLCLGLARRRITSNLLPATGPVGSGGDQGRDAESHWTNVHQELPSTTQFTALASGDSVVLACTTQTSGIPAKIRQDLESIATQGTPVDRVVYFTVAPVSVAKRHKLQAEAQNRYDVALDVWDGHAIAQHLADPDLYHLAIDYLQLPAELAPEQGRQGEGLPEWYVKDRTRWRDREVMGTLGELVDLMGPLRYATFNDEAVADLAEWIAHARVIMDQAGSEAVAARAKYEIAVATLRGLNTLRPVDDLVEDFLRFAQEGSDDLGIIQDATVLLEYCIGALARDITNLTTSDLQEHQARLDRKVSDLLRRGPYPNARARLLALDARLALHPQVPPEDVRGGQDLETGSELTDRVRTAVETGESLHVDSEIPLVDTDRGMNALTELVEALDEAPMFPLQDTTQLFDLLVPILVDHPKYRHVREGLDEATARSEGQAAKGDRAQSRALALLRAGRHLEALNEVHGAKLNWWQGETLEGALTMLLLASAIYSELGLPLAAKQCALGAAMAARASQDPDYALFMPRGIVLSATYDHQAGNWLSATRVFQIGVHAQAALADDPWDLDRYPYFRDMLVDQAFILRAARTVRTEYLSFVEDSIHATGLEQFLEPMLDTVEELPVYEESEYAEIADRDGIGRPFSDAGPDRCYAWAALGMRWFVRVANERAAVLAGERFVAAAQIVMAELAGEDPLLLAGDVIIDLEVGASANTEQVPDNEASRWSVRLTAIDHLEVRDASTQVTSALVTVLLSRSLMPYGDFMGLVEAAFENGLWHKLVAGRPYDEVADLLDPGDYEAMAELQTPPPGSKIARAPTPKSEEMHARSGPAPGYEREESLRAVRARYRNIPPMIRHTLPRLLQDDLFNRVVSELRSEGWLDWHLLTAIANYAANRRLEMQGIRPRLDMSSEQRAAFQRRLKRPERVSDPPVPAAEFTRDALERSLQGACLSTLANLGLECHQTTPDFGSIFDFLGRRYGYWADDVPHDDYFPGSDGQ